MISFLLRAALVVVLYATHALQGPPARFECDTDTSCGRMWATALCLTCNGGPEQ